MVLYIKLLTCVLVLESLSCIIIELYKCLVTLV